MPCSVICTDDRESGSPTTTTSTSTPSAALRTWSSHCKSRPVSNGDRVMLTSGFLVGRRNCLIMPLVIEHDCCVDIERCGSYEGPPGRRHCRPETHSLL